MSNWSEILTVVNQSFPTNIDLLNKKRKEYMDKIAEIPTITLDFYVK